jgi:hypothetical protein
MHNLLTDHDDAWLRSVATFSLGEIGTGPGSGDCLPAGPEKLVELAAADATEAVRQAARQAQRQIASRSETGATNREGFVLSVIEKIILMKEVPFFQGMTVDQLKVLASVCEEQFVPADGRVFEEGDAGGTLYVVVSGRVAIEQHKRAGSSARLATLSAHTYFGEINLFDGSPHSAAAIAIQDTQILRLRREPLIALARQHPDLSLALINVLSKGLRDANDRIADLTRSKPKELHKLYDAFG